MLLSRFRWPVTILAAIAAVAAVVFLPAPHAGRARAQEIFCQVGYHRVFRHGEWICVRNHPDHRGLVLVANDGTDPPQNVVFYVLNPSGHRVWFDAIGSGADAPAGVKALVEFMTADGFTLAIASHDCGWRTNPCVLEWPGPS